MSEFAFPPCDDCGGPGTSADMYRRPMVLCDPCNDHWLSRPSVPPMHGIRSALRRARAVGLPATLTLGEWDQAVAHFDDRCAYCGDIWTLIEHATPIERGGGTTRSNCLPACQSCNAEKKSRTIEEISVVWRRRSRQGPLTERALNWLLDCGREAFERMPEVEDAEP